MPDSLCVGSWTLIELLWEGEKPVYENAKNEWRDLRDMFRASKIPFEFIVTLTRRWRSISRAIPWKSGTYRCVRGKGEGGTNILPLLDTFPLFPPPGNIPDSLYTYAKQSTYSGKMIAAIKIGERESEAAFLPSADRSSRLARQQQQHRSSSSSSSSQTPFFCGVTAEPNA